MLRSTPLPPDHALTPRARALAYPDLTDAARTAIASAERDAATLALTPDVLLAAASERSGGLSDFGTAPLQEPLAVLCRSLEEDIELHALGRVFAFNQIAGLLTTRLRFEALWKRHPEILKEPIARPIIIIGLPRSGTTILHRMLAQDPAARFSPFWEQVMPLPDGDPEAPQPVPDPRIARMARAVESVYTLAPDLKSMHELLVEEPDEDISHLLFAFASKQFEWSYRVPGYVRYYHATDHTEGYRYFKRVLQTVQWLRGGGRWMLKAPQHLEQLGPLLTVFPDATLVQTHRDPVPAIISLSSLTTYGGRRYFAHPNPHAVGRHMAETVERLLMKGISDRPAGDTRFVDIQFPDLLADPIGVARRIYAVSGDTLSPEAEARMGAWIADNRQEKHGRHSYAAADVGLDIADLRRRLRAYQAHFGVPTDPRFQG